MNKKIIKTNKNYTYDILKNDLFFLKYEYPFFKIKAIGKSTLGENIIYIKLGKGNKKLFINSSHHANEWMTSLITMMFIEKYLQLYNKKEFYKGYDINELWEKVSLYIVPMVNPDGVNLCLKNKKIINEKLYLEIWEKYKDNLEDWKANIRGVDLNLQFPAGWEQAREIKFSQGFNRPAPRDFVGFGPLTEPESLAIYNFTLEHNFQLILAYHSQGEVIFWQFQNFNPPNARIIGELFEKASGYTLADTPFNSSFAGYKDWFIEKFNKPFEKYSTFLSTSSYNTTGEANIVPKYGAE